MRNFSDVVDLLLQIIAQLIPLIFAMTLLYILWNVVDAWIIGGGEESKIEKGRNTVVVGIIALVAMTGIWGILNILRGSFFGF